MRVSPLDITHSLFTCSVLNVLPVKRTSCVPSLIFVHSI